MAGPSRDQQRRKLRELLEWYLSSHDEDWSMTVDDLMTQLETP